AVRVSRFDALQNESGGDNGTGVLLESVLGGLGALIVLAFVFASFLAIVPIAMAIVSIMTTFLLVWGLTAFTDISPVVQFLIALVGLGVAIDYSLLIASRWREERAPGRRGDEAVQRAMETAGRAVVFSGTTVAIGLLAMVALPVPFLRSMGYGGMLIPLVSTLVAITLLPVVLSKVGHRLDWPHRRTDDRASRAWTRWAQAVVRRRWVAAGSAVAILTALIIAATVLTLRDAAHAAGPDVRVGGLPAQNEDFINAVYGNFPLMIALIGFVTFVLLARAFRSLLLPLKAVALNVASVAAAWGVLALMWQNGHG